MDRRRRFGLANYGIGGLGLLVALVGIAAYSGEFPSVGRYFPAFAGRYTVVAFLVGPVLVHLVVVGWLRTRYWTATATGASLTADEGGRFRPPDFSGVVDGRPVHARVHLGNTWLSGGRFEANATVVQAELDGPTEEGAVLGPREGARAYAPFDVEEHADAGDERLVAVATDDELARAVTTTPHRLLELERPGQVYAGKVEAVYERMKPDAKPQLQREPKRSILLSHADGDTGYTSGLAEATTGGTAAVTYVVGGTVMDAEELTAQLEAVVAVADAFEGVASTGSHPEAAR